MSNEPHVTIEFRRYLLGELPEPARTAFEEAYFSDPELMEEIWAAESDLVDAYVNNRLDGDERSLFESRYLTSPQRRERVAVARALQARIRAVGLAPVTAETATAAGTVDSARAGQDAPAAPVPFRSRTVAGGADAGRVAATSDMPSGRLKALAKPRYSLWHLAAAAALVLAAATIAWLMMRGGPVALPPPSNASSTPAPPVTTPEPTPKPTPPDAVPPGATPNTPGTVATNPPSTTPPSTTPPGGTRSPLTVLAVTLSPIQLRSDAGQTSVAVPPNADRIALRFEGDRGAAREVAVDIRTVEGTRVWTGGVRIERPTAPGVAATVTVPAKALAPDDYIATLFAIDTAGERTELNRYVFRIARP